MVKQTIQIFARIKPTRKTSAVYSVDNEDQIGSSLAFVVPRDLAQGFINNKKESYKFRFQKIFDQSAKQEDIFENIAKPVADSVLAGYNGTIFAYGQTGSGKTFTITGGAEHYRDRGIIPRTLSYLYECFSQESSMVYTTHISYLEIYNDTGYDLLESRQDSMSRLEDLPKISIQEDPDQNVHLRNLSMLQSTNEEEALNLLFLGDTNRMIAETPTNQASTRSHCIFTVHLCRREPGSATVRRSKLHLVDLAGSDRVYKTGLNGQLLTEAKYINLSLHYLEQVIIALSEKNRSHIPYRNSMLTSVLRDSLGGNCMTTMIATLAVDKRNIDESISTCRFAQRVALIKNEAILNEELDPALLIARLKKEVQSLKEELSMVTGIQREDQLTGDEIDKLEELLKTFLEDSDPEVTLNLGPDMRNIQHCFYRLKMMVLEKPSRGAALTDGKMTPEATLMRGHIQESQQCVVEVTKLKEMLTQRDNEISILIKMLKNEKKRAQDAATQLAKLTQSQDIVSPRAAVFRVTNEESSEEDTNLTEVHTEGRAIQYMKRGPKLSMGKQEAFEIFLRDHEDHLTIEENKTQLKQRSVEAKGLGGQLNETRNRINELKKQLELRRRQMAAHAVLENHMEFQDDVDPVEEKLRKQIEQEKKIYKSTIARLKALRTEIEHLQLLLERAKVKLQRDFQKWWSEEASRVQESEAMARNQTASLTKQPSPHSPISSESNSTLSAVQDYNTGQVRDLDYPTYSAENFRSPTPKRGPPVTTVPAWVDELAQRTISDMKSSSQLRDLSTTSITSSIPLTGDKKADADIMAFVKAREKLLQKTRQHPK
ncbi:kinesin-like protein KIF6 [Boleophthalmus pectinirostris]|uniref:kinesin-like protein KIF6 n=1 Tax=Boleophthalmus pectinirostris TaxID=150288 RepID=UPI00242BD0CB|nr:kinesin-like protein KIF6 [Boleophthalmus pectinirostris]